MPRPAAGSEFGHCFAGPLQNSTKQHQLSEAGSGVGRVWNMKVTALKSGKASIGRFLFGGGWGGILHSLRGRSHKKAKVRCNFGEPFCEADLPGPRGLFSEPPASKADNTPLAMNLGSGWFENLV